MPQVLIENPILNSPHKEPTRHFKFSDDGITDEIVESRRISTYFVPIAKPRKKAGGKQLALDTGWTQDRVEENKDINRIREKVSIWRKGNYAGITNTTRQLLEYWTNSDRERKLFFCEIEAMETAIYLAEVVNKYGDNWIENSIRQHNENANPGLYRVALKMATGSGKTVVMAMLIAWQVLNKIVNPQDARFTDAFLIVTPGITIRDRLRVLYPNDPQNYYQQRDIVSLSQMAELGRAKIIITNFHTFKLRELVKAGKLTKGILANGQSSSLTETPDQMVRRVCRELGSKKNIIVINDEAHHCYRHKVEAEELKLTGDDRLESYASQYLQATGEYTDKDGKTRRVAVSIGPQYGTVGPDLVKEAAKEAVKGVGFDLLIVCGFAFDPHVSEEAKRYGSLTVLITKMNPDLSMGDELLKSTGAGNLFMVFGEPDVVINKQKDGEFIIEIKGLDIYDPTTGQVRSNSTEDIACWFIDTDYNGESFFVRHAYFTDGEDKYERLKKTLKAEIDESVWDSLYATVSRPFAPPKTGKIAIKVINHYGDEVLKVYEVK